MRASSMRLETLVRPFLLEASMSLLGVKFAPRRTKFWLDAKNLLI